MTIPHDHLSEFLQKLTSAVSWCGYGLRLMRGIRLQL